MPEILQDTQSEVLQALEDVIRSGPFRTTRQCQDLLRYVVGHSLAGEANMLRERVIGAEVFGRPPDYDTGQDPVVRIRAADVRRRLAQYYQDCGSGLARVRIEMPSGSYRAVFHWPSPEGAQDAPPHPTENNTTEATSAAAPGATASSALLPYVEAAPAPGSLTGHRRRRWLIALPAAILLCVVIAVAVSLSARKQDAAFHRFWAPFLDARRPVLVCMGSNVVYQLSHDFMVKYAQERHLEGSNLEMFVDLPPDAAIAARDVHKAKDSFVALGDVAAISNVAVALTREGVAFQERFPPDISFAELQGTPTILIGGFNNALTLALTNENRFVLTQNSRIEDHQKPDIRWSVQFNGDARHTDDYAVISRFLNAASGGPLISVAGIGQFGTQAAAEYISNPSKLAMLLSKAPANWAGQNLQAVIHVRVIDFRPVSTEVVAYQFW